MKKETDGGQANRLPRKQKYESASPKRRRLPGRTYFSRQAEQRVFFYLTLAMLLAGLVCRLF